MLVRAQVEGTGGSDKGREVNPGNMVYRKRWRGGQREDKLNRGDIRRRGETEANETV